MTNIALQFIKKNFTTVAAAQAASTSVQSGQGAIVFDKQHKIICVDGTVFGGNIQDASFTNNILTITKADGTDITLNFSDVASASQIMAVFNQLKGLLGISGDETYMQGSYASTHYLQGVQTFVNADKTLDNQIYTVQGHVQGVQGAIETVQGHVQGVQSSVETVQGYLQNVSNASKVTVVKQQTAETGYLDTYVVQQNGVQVGAKINIPKDFLVKSAEVKVVTTADQPYTGAVVGDKYIDFVINVKSGTATDEHIYLPVKDLVDAYSVQQNATQIQLAISESNEISATIVAGSVGTTELASQGVTSQKIGVQAVQTWNVAQGAITTDNLDAGVVSTPQTVPVVIPGDTQATTIATVAGKNIQIKVSPLYWDEWSDQ